MFKIGKGDVVQLDQNKSSVIIKQWVQQDWADAQLGSEKGETKQQEEANEQLPLQQTQVPAGQEHSAEEHEKQGDQRRRPAVQDTRNSDANVEQLAMKRAERLIDDAQEYADALINKAEQGAQKIREEAYEAGFVEGREAAKEMQKEAELDLQRQFDEIMATVNEGELFRDGMFEESTIKLSLEIAKKIIGQQVEQDETAFISMIKEAIKRLNEKEKFTIRLNQREYEKFFKDGSGFLAEQVQSAPFTVLADSEVEPGGIVLTGQGGMVIAGVDDQLNKLSKAILNEDSEQ